VTWRVPCPSERGKPARASSPAYAKSTTLPGGNAPWRGVSRPRHIAAPSAGDQAADTGNAARAGARAGSDAAADLVD
jgi:hypothetical protein